MIRINLLPFRAARRQENIRRQISVFMLSLFFTAVCMFYFNIHLNRKIDSLQTDIKRTKSELASFQKIIAEINDIQKKLKVLETKMQVIQNLEAGRVEAVNLLNILPETVVPERMWFTSLNDTRSQVIIQGIAMDNQTAADFMIRLEKSTLFSSVRLKALKQQGVGGGVVLKNFELICTKKPPTPAAAKKKSAK
jgi:type IV pilus assembly protein PilN